MTHSGHGLQHHAFVYESDEQYLAALVPRIEAALTDGQAVIAALHPDNESLLRAHLAGTATAVSWMDATQWYQHPVRTIAGYDDTLRAAAVARPAFAVGEVQFGEEADWTAWFRYESALNRALARHRAYVVCPYDARVLPAEVIAHASRTHPYLLDGDVRRSSPDYEPPERFLRNSASPPVLPLTPPDVEITVGSSTREARRRFAALPVAAALVPRLDELTVALNEVVTNALVHGGGSGVLRVWSDDDQLTCAVDDGGDGADDPLLGYCPPERGVAGGHGLWLARQLFDRVDMSALPGGGLRVVLVATA